LEDKYIPVKKSYSSGRMKKPIWMSLSAVNCVIRKNKFFKKYKDKNHPAVKKANKKATKALRKAKHIFEKKLADSIKQDKKSFYAYTRSKSKTKVQVRSLLTTDGIQLEDDSDVVKSFNHYFASVFTKDDVSCSAVPIVMMTGDTELRCTNLHLDINIVTKAILRLKPDKALGPDELSPKLLIETCNEIAYPLLLLFRKSLNESSVPNDWKQTNVTPIFKKSSRSSVENYRPVSLTSQVCKLFK